MVHTLASNGGHVASYNECFLSVRIPKTSAEWLKKREQETDTTTSQLIRRLIRMEIESVRDLESDMEGKENATTKN